MFGVREQLPCRNTILKVAGGMVTILTLIAMLPAVFGDQSSDERPEQDVEQMLDEMAEEKLKTMHDVDHTADFFGRCMVSSFTDEFSDITSPSLTCFELETVSVGRYVEFGWDIRAQDFLTSSHMTVGCNYISLKSLVKPQYQAGEETRVRYRFDKRDHVEQNWFWSGLGGFAWYMSSSAEVLDFLSNVVSSDQLIFEVGGGRGQLSFGERTIGAVAELADRCDIKIH